MCHFCFSSFLLLPPLPASMWFFFFLFPLLFHSVGATSSFVNADEVFVIFLVGGSWSFATSLIILICCALCCYSLVAVAFLNEWLYCFLLWLIVYDVKIILQRISLLMRKENNYKEEFSWILYLSKLSDVSWWNWKFINLNDPFIIGSKEYKPLTYMWSILIYLN